MFLLEKGKIDLPGKTLFKFNKLVVHSKQQVCILGKNGCGKTTFIKSIVNGLSNGLLNSNYVNNFDYVPQLPENINSLSGGEKTKAALVKAFRKRNSLLLLDEPSSNLDETQQQWLQVELKKHNGPIIIVSHDEELLNQADELWVIDQQVLKVFHGNYQTYCKQKAKEDAAQNTAYRQQRNEIERLKKQVISRTQKAYRLKNGNGKKMSNSEKKSAGRTSHDAMEKKMQQSAKAIQRRIDRMEKINHVFKAKPIKFVDPNKAIYQKKTLLSIQNENIFIGEKQLINHVNLKVKYGNRIWIRGQNGSGKTTLIKHILNHREKFIPSNINVGYFNQELKQIDLNKTVWNNAAENSVQTNEVIFSVLAGLDLKDFNQPANQLSGGQKVRLQLAQVLLGNNQLIILDEPTNYLDLGTKKALKEFLENYPGTLILISHDRNFATKVTDQSLFIHDKKLEKFDKAIKYSKPTQGEILKLKMTLDQLIADPRSSQNEIKNIKEKINFLKSD